MNIETINGVVALIWALAFASFWYFLLQRMWRYCLGALAALITLHFLPQLLVAFLAT
jgi:hypothetical protein